MMKHLSVLLMGILAVPLQLALASEAPAPVDHQALFRLWQKPLKPAPGRSESIGSYSAGCLVGGESLPLDGLGYSVMRVSRVRNFGHPKLLSYIEGLGAATAKAGLPRILVGDLGRPRGGPMISGHASHQVGLDVDIWYQTAKKKPSLKDRESWGAESFVSRQGKVNKAWKKEQRELVKLAAAADEVERIFVHAAIKRDLCEAYPGETFLRKLRPWWGHDDHLHVRLKCVEGDNRCENQEPAVADANHCGSDLDWWFSKEAKEELAKKKAVHGRIFPSLPAACVDLVAEYSEKAK